MVGRWLGNNKYTFHLLQTHQQLRLPMQHAVQPLPGETVEPRHSIYFPNVGQDGFGVDLPYSSTGKYVDKLLAGVGGEDGRGCVCLAVELLGPLEIFSQFVGGYLFEGMVVEYVG